MAGRPTKPKTTQIVDVPPAIVELVITPSSQNAPIPTRFPAPSPGQAGDGHAWLEKYLAQATEGTRNDTGKLLCLQLRDDGLSQTQAEAIMREYAARVPGRGYTEREALSTVRSIYSRPPRQPARAAAQASAAGTAHADDSAPTDSPEMEQDPDDEGDKKSGSGRGPSMASQLVTLSASAHLFHDGEGTTWATVTAGAHRETWPLHSKGFKRWLARRLYETERRTPNAQALQDALTVLDGQATFDGPTESVHVRLAELDGAIYLDLADEQWRAVQVTADGWRVVSGDELPVRFRRSKGMLPLPAPIAGGSVNALRSFVNLGNGDDGHADWTLLVAWLLGSLRPTGPYPVLALSGEQGSAKSSTARMLRSLLDPNIAALRSEPKELRDLAIAANNSWTIVLDNLSGMPSWLSDALCRLSTGGGSAYRTLYENDDETIFNAQRPIILTGIEEVASRGDLVDRSILLALPTIPDEKRRPESAIWAEFEQTRPAILGALLTAVAGAMRTLPSTQLDKLPRMADFALWVTAAEHTMQWQPRTFLTAYTANRKNANALTLEASLVAGALLAFIESGATWKGTMGELHATLLEQDATLKDKHGWPATARGLSGAIARIAPNLRAVGFTISDPARGGHDRKRERTITRASQEEEGERPSAPSAPSSEAAKPEINATSARTVLRTVWSDADDVPSAPEPNRPRAKPESMRKADDADDADGSSRPLSKTPYPAWRLRMDQLIRQGISPDEATRIALQEKGAL